MIWEASMGAMVAAYKANLYARHAVPNTRPPPTWTPPAPTLPTKCASCGSREFKEHGGQTVCAYCRSGA